MSLELPTLGTIDSSMIYRVQYYVRLFVNPGYV